MTKEDILPRTRTIIGLIRDFFWIGAVVTPLMLVMIYGAYFVNRGWIVKKVREELGIETLATASDMHRLTEKVETLAKDVRRATGEDRVIRQPAGLSYVEEPVRGGQNVVMWLTVARTNLGKSCRLVDWTPLFTDGRNVPFVGSRPDRAVWRQIGTEFEKLRIEMTPPANLEAGRIEVYLTLDYECEGRRVPDRTDVVTYQLLDS